MKKFIDGLGRLLFNGVVIGYIEKGSFDWGGTKGESTDIEAEQVPNAPVFSLVTKNSSLAPTFNLIQLDYKGLKQVAGGTLVGPEEAPTGWKAPAELVELRGETVIDFVSGQTWTAPNTLLMSNLAGKLTLSEVSKMECQLKVNAPEDGGSPYEINDTVEA